MSNSTAQTTNPVKVDTTPARDVLTQLVKVIPEGSLIELRTFSDKRDKSLHPGRHWLPSGADDEQITNALNWSVSENEQGKGVFIAYNPRREGKGTKDDVKTMIAVYADLDVYKTTKTIDEALQAIRTAPMQPHYVINSGRGLQIIYLIEPTTEKSLWRMAQEGLYERFKEYGADKAVVSDEARVLRLPGFLHLKDEPLPTSIIESHDGARLHVSEFIDHFSPEGDEDERLGGKLKRHTMPESIAEGEGRNKFLISEAGRVKRMGANEDEILSWLTTLNLTRCVPPFPVSVIEDMARRVAKYNDGTDYLTEKIIKSNASSDEDDEADDLQSTIIGATMSLGELEADNTPEPEFVLYSLAVGEIGMIQAKPSQGKTQVMRNLSLRLATGQSFADLYDGGEPVKVLYVDGEDTRPRVKGDFDTMKTSLSPEHRQLANSNIRTLVTDDLEKLDVTFDLKAPATQKAVITAAKQHSARLIIFDTITSLYGFSSENDNAEVQRVMKILKRIAQQSGAAVLYAHHLGKGSGFETETSRSGDNVYKSRGGSAFAGLCRLIIHLEGSKADDGTELLSMTYAKTKAELRSGVVFTKGDPSRWLIQRTDVTTENIDDVEYRRTIAVITEQMTKAEVMEARKDRSKASVERDLDRGIAEGKLEKPRRGIYQPFGYIPLNPPHDVEGAMSVTL